MLAAPFKVKFPEPIFVSASLPSSESSKNPFERIPEKVSLLATRPSPVFFQMGSSKTLKMVNLH